MKEANQLQQITLQEVAEKYGKNFGTEDLFITEEDFLHVVSDKPRRTNAYMIGISTVGTATVEINLQTYTESSYCFLSIGPHHTYNISELSSDFRCSFVIFSRELFADATAGIQNDFFTFLLPDAFPIIKLDEQNGKHFANLIHFIKKQSESKKGEMFEKEIMSTSLLLLLYEMEAIYRKTHATIIKKMSRKDELHRQFFHLLFDHFKEQRSVRYYADNLYVTPKHLTETIRQTSGKPVGEWIDDAVILEAKVLLKNAPLNISQIADALHFPNQSTFGRYFKLHTGKSPLHYRSLAGSEEPVKP